jgi:hypothetical protein
MKRTIIMLAATGALATLVMWAPTVRHGSNRQPVVYASTGCNDASLTGGFGFSWQGFDVPNQGIGNQVPYAAVGRVSFDGAGNVVSDGLTTSLGGKISTGGTGAGTYTVNPNCTGSISFTTGDAAGSTFNMVVISGGMEIFVISTLPTQTIAFHAVKQ